MGSRTPVLGRLILHGPFTIADEVDRASLGTVNTRLPS